MGEQFEQFFARFDALQQRERLTIAIAVLLGGLLLGYMLLVDPQLARQKTQTKRIATLKADIANQEVQIATLQAQMIDPDARTRQELQDIKKRMAALDQRLTGIQDSLVPADKMQGFLEGLLVRHRNLELLSLHTLAPEPLLAQKTPAAAELDDGKPIAQQRVATPVDQGVAGNLYKHAVQIRVAGRYGDLLRYLAELESMPQRIVWHELELVAEESPRCVMVVTVYTLSLNKQWLVV